MNTIPVLIHHELDEKPQTGGKRNQGYVKDCIIQAKQYYQNVILFGSKGNQSFCEQWCDVSDFNSKKWQEFLAVFENMSTYPDEWARGIFKRFFVFLEYLKETGERECIVLDSDVLIYQDYSELFDFSDIDAAMELPSNQKMEMLPYNNDYRWVACAGVSYFKTEALEDFLDFCIETYKNNKGLLNEKWEIHRKYGLPGGV